VNTPRNHTSSFWGGALLPVLLLACAVAGCHNAAGWEGAAGPPPVTTYYPRQAWRFRLTEGYSLPEGLATPLCDQYQVFEVRDSRSWQEMRQALHLRGVNRNLDFSRGMVVGLAGTLGEPLSGNWPLHIDHLKQSHGLGSLTVRVEEGLYNPTRGSPYCVMAYVPGLESLAIVRVNQRLFYLE